MRKRFISFFSGLVLMMMVLLLNSGFFAFAIDEGRGTVAVGYNSVMTQAKAGIKRTRDFSYASVAVSSVYPVNTYSEDNYTRCFTKLFHNTIGNTPISDKYLLMEGTGYQKITINEGYLSQSKFDLCFAGYNANLAAYIAYAYKGN